VVPAQRATAPPEEESGPAVRLIEAPDGELRVECDGPIDSETLRGICDDPGILGEGESRGMDADLSQAVIRISRMPSPQVGQRTHRVELGDVEEVDQGGPGRDQSIDRLDRLTNPVEARRKRGNGDVGARGSQTPEGMLRRSPKKERSL
jgi:hypothetical protein